MLGEPCDEFTSFAERWQAQSWSQSCVCKHGDSNRNEQGDAQPMDHQAAECLQPRSESVAVDELPVATATTIQPPFQSTSPVTPDCDNDAVLRMDASESKSGLKRKLDRVDEDQQPAKSRLFTSDNQSSQPVPTPIAMTGVELAEPATAVAVASSAAYTPRTTGGLAELDSDSSPMEASEMKSHAMGGVLAHASTMTREQLLELGIEIPVENDAWEEWAKMLEEVKNRVGSMDTIRIVVFGSSVNLSSDVISSLTGFRLPAHDASCIELNLSPLREIEQGVQVDVAVSGADIVSRTFRGLLARDEAAEFLRTHSNSAAALTSTVVVVDIYDPSIVTPCALYAISGLCFPLFLVLRMRSPKQHVGRHEHVA